jgi:hypothetical protein
LRLDSDGSFNGLHNNRAPNSAEPIGNDDETTCHPNSHLDRGVSTNSTRRRNHFRLRARAFGKSIANSLVSDTGHEVTQKNGQVLEFGSHLTLTIQRPSQASGRFESRNGDISIIVLDGKTLSVYGAIEDVDFYDATRQPGDIDSSLEFVANQVAVPRQLRDFFSKDLTASLGSAMKSGYYVGESRISGVMCDHLALRGDKEDVQVWIARGDEPVPRRIVITYRELEGQPQFWAQFVEWNFSPDLSDTAFTFSPPEGAERIRLFSDPPGEGSK